MSSAMVVMGMPLVYVEKEPRVSHVELAKRLGYAQSRVLLKLVREHEEKLSRFGVLHSEVQNPSRKGGRPTETLFLNQEQVLFICSKSEQDVAVAITIQMVHVFAEALRTRAPSGIAQVFHRLLAPAPTEWDEMFTDELVRSLVALDRQTWVGGTHPRYLRSTYAKIYDMVVGSDVWAEMGRRQDDPAFLHARKHQQLQPGPRQAFRGELEFVRLLADQSRTKDEFWARMELRYGDGMLQFGFGQGFDEMEVAS